jgi:hypothetical protein
VDLRSKKVVLGLIALVCLVVFVGGMAAAWHNRHRTVCGNGQLPVKQKGGYFNPSVFKCPDGRIVTTPG